MQLIDNKGYMSGLYPSSRIVHCTTYYTGIRAVVHYPLSILLCAGAGGVLSAACTEGNPAITNRERGITVGHRSIVGGYIEIVLNGGQPSSRGLLGG